jgi:hypothetical protein
MQMALEMSHLLRLSHLDSFRVILFAPVPSSGCFSICSICL